MMPLQLNIIGIMMVVARMELFGNAQFYCKHPTLISYFTNHKKVFSCFESVLKICVSVASFETVLTSEELVQHEAVYNCHDTHWSKLYKVLFSNIVNPRKLPSFK